MTEPGRRGVMKGGMAVAAAAMLPAGVARAELANVPRDRLNAWPLMIAFAAVSC